MEKQKLVVLSGAGISAESGLKTFRDSNGLWEEHDIQDVATPEGWARNPELVLRFYNERRRQLAEARPNRAHRTIAELEDRFDVDVITQNVDDLHERAGSTQVIHLHGELTKVRSSVNDLDVKDIRYKDVALGDRCANGHQLRPHIVWFGEAVPLIESAAAIVSQADVVIVVGTSLNVYPAAGLLQYAHINSDKYIIDPDRSLVIPSTPGLSHIKEKATIGLPMVAQILLK